MCFCKSRKARMCGRNAAVRSLQESAVQAVGVQAAGAQAVGVQAVGAQAAGAQAAGSRQGPLALYGMRACPVFSGHAVSSDLRLTDVVQCSLGDCFQEHLRLLEGLIFELIFICCVFRNLLLFPGPL